MPKSYTEVQAAYEAGNIMDWTNAINRLNGIPLDPTSVFNSYDDAVIYAATSPVAYENQLIVAAGVAYIVTRDEQSRHNITGTDYPVHLVALLSQYTIESLIARIIALENKSTYDDVVIDGGSAYDAESDDLILALDGGNAAQSEITDFIQVVIEGSNANESERKAIENLLTIRNIFINGGNASQVMMGGN